MDTTRERNDPHCLDPEQLTDLLRDVPWRRLLVMGDSIAAGVGDPVDGYDDASWADRLAHALGGDRNRPSAYRNLGEPGLRAAEVRQQQLEAALAFGPDLAVVTAGANDAMRRSFDPGRVADELDGLLHPLAERACQVVTFGVLDLSRTRFVPDGMRVDLQRRIRRLNAVTREVSARHAGVHVDFFAHPALDDDLFSADMIHPNRRGHAHIATSVVRALARRGGVPVGALHAADRS